MAGLPPPVSAGSRVAVVFPAGRPGDDQSGLELLREWGLEPVVHDLFGGRIKKPTQTDDADASAAHFMARCFNTCLPDEDRARALEAAFLDDGCDAVICGRGGYGCMRLLDLLDWSKLTPAVLRRKRFVGFSDITALHLAFQTVAPGLVTLHGPMPASCFKSITQPDADRLWAALFADASAGAAWFAPLPGLMLHDAAAPSPRPQCTRAVGRLVGGNLALLSAMVGTPFCPCGLTARGPSILCIEDIGEPPYRLDRMWQQLKLSGILRNVVAILLGNFVPREQGAESPFSIFDERPQGPPVWPDGTEKWSRKLESEAFFWRDVCAMPADIPVLWSLEFGHGGVNATMPLGAVLAVDGAKGLVEIPTAEEMATYEDDAKL